MLLSKIYARTVHTDQFTHQQVKALLKYANTRLRQASISEPIRLEAELLVCNSLGLHRREDLLQFPSIPSSILSVHHHDLDTISLADLSSHFSPSAIQKLSLSLHRRCVNREPLAVIIGKKSFMNIELEVDRSTLLPRPDSETLVEAALNILRTKKQTIPLTIGDLGSGSGALLLSTIEQFAVENVALRGVAVERSVEAFRVIRRNTARILENLPSIVAQKPEIDVVCMDWNELLCSETHKSRFDLVLSNPPYLTPEELYSPETQPELLSEPVTALVGGKDGLECYRELGRILPFILKTGGHFVIEIGRDQRKTAVDALESSSNGKLRVESKERDLAGIERCLVGRYLE